MAIRIFQRQLVQWVNKTTKQQQKRKAIASTRSGGGISIRIIYWLGHTSALRDLCHSFYSRGKLLGKRVTGLLGVKGRRKPGKHSWPVLNSYSCILNITDECHYSREREEKMKERRKRKGQFCILYREYTLLEKRRLKLVDVFSLTLINRLLFRSRLPSSSFLVAKGGVQTLVCKMCSLSLLYKSERKREKRGERNIFLSVSHKRAGKFMWRNN